MNKQNKNIKRTGYFTINLKDEKLDCDVTLDKRKKMFAKAIDKLKQHEKKGLIYINSIDYMNGEIMYEIL